MTLPQQQVRAEFWKDIQDGNMEQAFKSIQRHIYESDELKTHYDTWAARQDKRGKSFHDFIVDDFVNKAAIKVLNDLSSASKKEVDIQDAAALVKEMVTFFGLYVNTVQTDRGDSFFSTAVQARGHAALCLAMSFAEQQGVPTPRLALGLHAITHGVV